MLKITNIILIILIVFSTYRTQTSITYESNQNFYNSYNKVSKIILKIPKINFLYALDINETLENGLEIHQISSERNMPLVIMGHSGIGINSYFNDLDQINDGDEIIINKKGSEFIYKVENIFYHDKSKNLSVLKDSKYLYLITCDKKDLTKQLIISSKIA